MSNPTSKLRTIEPYRSKDGVTAEVYHSKLGGTGAVVIQADTGTGEDAEVVLSVQEVRDLVLWLQCALSGNSSAPETKPDVEQEFHNIDDVVTIRQLKEAIYWALGERGDFPEEPEPLAGKYRRRYHWRTELRRRSGLPVGGSPPETECQSTQVLDGKIYKCVLRGRHELHDHRLTQKASGTCGKPVVYTSATLKCWRPEGHSGPCDGIPI